MTARTTVDVLSLEDFRVTLARRLTEVEAVLAKLNTELQCRPPALGTFTDAAQEAQRYRTLHQQYVERAERLKVAIEATQAATAQIIADYATTEERNRANAADIAGALGSVSTALDGTGSPHV